MGSGWWARATEPGCWSPQRALRVVSGGTRTLAAARRGGWVRADRAHRPLRLSPGLQPRCPRSGISAWRSAAGAGTQGLSIPVLGAERGVPEPETEGKAKCAVKGRACCKEQLQPGRGLMPNPAAGLCEPSRLTVGAGHCGLGPWRPFHSLLPLPPKPPSMCQLKGVQLALQEVGAGCISICQESQSRVGFAY